MPKALKFTKAEQKKLKVVFEKLREELNANQWRNDSAYDNDLGCGNCGDTSAFHHLLRRLEKETGISK